MRRLRYIWVLCGLLGCDVDRYGTDRGMRNVIHACRYRMSLAATHAESLTVADAVVRGDYAGDPTCSYWIAAYREVP